MVSSIQLPLFALSPARSFSHSCLCFHALCAALCACFVCRERVSQLEEENRRLQEAHEKVTKELPIQTIRKCNLI